MMSHSQPKIGLVLMIGLPGSGKTTLANRLSQFIKTQLGAVEANNVHVFTYDDMIPVSMQSGRDVQSWKQAREGVMKKVENVVCELQAIIFRDQQLCSYLIIDDNMYYRSMRYEYFQLARKYGLSFCQLYLVQTEKDALEYNTCRSSHSVPEEVIKRMSKRLQPPNPLHNTWEQHSLSLTARSDYNIPDICNFVKVSLEHPIQPVDDSTPKMAPSIVHTIDLQLRKIVGEIMKTSVGDGGTMRTKAAALNKQRHLVLDRLRAGDITFPTEDAADFLLQLLVDEFDEG